MIRIVKFGLAACVLLLIVGSIYQIVQSRSDNLAFPAPGKLYDVAGLMVHLDCRGDGSPTLVMEAGLTQGSKTWSKIRDALSHKTQFCAYDRPGLDWSEPLGKTASAEEISQRLHQLLQVAKIDGPKILVGMSAGGVYVREYYQHFPENIVGMAFIDSSHEQQGNRLPVIESDNSLEMAFSFCKAFQWTGLIRAMGFLDPFINIPGISESDKPLRQAKLNQSHSCASIRFESLSFSEEVRDVEEPKSLGDLPLLVLSQGKQPEANEANGMTFEQALRMGEVWNELQIELTNLSTQGQRFVAKNSGHVIQREQPELIIEKLSEFIDQVRSNKLVSNTPDAS